MSRLPSTSSSAGPRVAQIPHGDDRERLVCPDCGFVHYDNPKVVVGSVVRWRGRILLCRRNIAPRRGYWALPAGYLELNETVQDGALREAWEEACARITLDGVLAVYNIPRLSQVQIIYRARLLAEEFAPGPESQEVQLFAWNQLPWADLAFPSVRWALDHDREVGEATVFAARTNPPEQTGDFSLTGSSGSDR